MKTYLVRSLRYLAQLVLLIAAVYALLYFTGYASIAPPELFPTWRGWLLAALLVVLAALYPSYGYVDRYMDVDPQADRDKILKAMDMGDYALARDDGRRMVFHRRNAFKRAVGIGQDTVTVTREGGGIVVGGLRKEVVKVDYRLRSMFQ